LGTDDPRASYRRGRASESEVLVLWPAGRLPEDPLAAELDDEDEAAHTAAEELRVALRPQRVAVRVAAGRRLGLLALKDCAHALRSARITGGRPPSLWVITFGSTAGRRRDEAFLPPPRIPQAVALLSDADIVRYVAKGELRIEPFSDGNLTPNGYDVTIEEVVVPSSGDRVREGTAAIPPHTRFAVSTREVVALGRHLAAQIWLRTTWARRGIVGSFGMIDAGFTGSLTFGAFNASDATLEIHIGDRFAQVVFLTLESPASGTYQKRSGNYQNQRGVTFERP